MIQFLLNIRAIFTKRGGNLGTNGSLAFLFDRKGVITIPRGDIDPDELQMEIIDAGVEDFQIEDDVFVVTTPLEDFGNVQKKLEELKIEAQNTELQRIPNDTQELAVEDALKILRVIEEFEDDDDVQNVFHNVEITDEIMEAM